MILVVASDLHEEAPIWWLQVKNAVKRGAKLVVANGRTTRLDKYAAAVIRYHFGREAETILKLLPDSESAGESGKIISEAENLVVFYGSDGLSLSGSKDLSIACAQLLQKNGQSGKSNSGLIPVWQRANDQGAWDIGYRPDDQLEKMISTADALYIAGADPAGESPVYANAIKKAGFVIVQELFLSETAKLADIVFPVQSIVEREGSFTNGMRRVQRFTPVLEKLPGTRADFLVTAQVRQKVVHSNLEIGSAGQMFMVMTSHLQDYHDLSYARLAETNPQRPIIGRSDLYYGGTSYENNQGLGKQLSTVAVRGERSLFPNFHSLNLSCRIPNKQMTFLHCLLPSCLIGKRCCSIQLY